MKSEDIVKYVRPLSSSHDRVGDLVERIQSFLSEGSFWADKKKTTFDKVKVNSSFYVKEHGMTTYRKISKTEAQTGSDHLRSIRFKPDTPVLVKK